jgi:hypothetical protein
MFQAIFLKARLPKAAKTAATPFSTTPRRCGIFFKEKDNPLDQSKEHTDSIDQAKDQEGSTPAYQHAKAIGHSVNEKSGTPGPSESKSSSDSPGLGSEHAQEGKKPGEEAVNPVADKR